MNSEESEINNHTSFDEKNDSLFPSEHDMNS